MQALRCYALLAGSVLVLMHACSLAAQEVVSSPHTGILSDAARQTQDRLEVVESAKRETLSQLRNLGGKAAIQADLLESLPASKVMERLAVKPPVGPSTIAAPPAGASVPQPSVNYVGDAGGATTGHPGVALLLAQNAGSKIFTVHCTGTLIQQNIILTAAHCICYSPDPLQNYETGKVCKEGDDDRTPAPLLDKTRWRVFFQHAGVRQVSSVQIDDSYQFTKTTVRDDLAVLVLDRPIVEINPPAIPAEVNSPSGWAQGYVVGFGYSARPEGKPAAFLQQLVLPGIKAQGTVSEATCATQAYLDPAASLCSIFSTGAGDLSNATICGGDSGGPLWTSANGNPDIGVASGRDKENCAQDGTVSFEMSIATAAQRNWVNTQLAQFATPSKKGRWPTFGENLRHVPDRRNVGAFGTDGTYASDGWLTPQEDGTVLATINSSGSINKFQVVDTSGSELCHGVAGFNNNIPNVDYCSARIPMTSQYHLVAQGSPGESLQTVITVHPVGAVFN